jgi:hypothetical protein
MIYFSLMAISAVFLSFRWPLDKGWVTSTFGESRGDHYHDGIDIVCPDDRVHAAAPGKLLYYWDKSLFPLENEPGGGNYLVIQHEKDLCSVYMHLEQGISSEYPDKAGESIATVGNTGHSFSKHLHFSLINRVVRESVNPLSLLPPGEDKKPPVIGAILLKIADRYVQIRDKSAIRLTRHYPILVDINDTITGKEKLGVYILRAFFNDQMVCDMKFDSITYSEQGLAVQSKIFPDVMDEKGYYIISNLKHRQGENILRVEVRDFSGNTSEKSFSYSADLDMEQELR